MMLYTDYTTYITEAKECASAAELLAQYGYPADSPYTPDQLTHIFDVIYAVSRNDLSALRDLCGGNMSAMSRKYGIPLRTLQDWIRGARRTPDYVTALIGYAEISEIRR